MGVYLIHCSSNLSLLFVLLFVSLAVVASLGEDSSHVVVIEFSRSFALISVIMMMVNGFFCPKPLHTRPGTRGDTIRRVRRSVSNIMYELGAYSRRYYRMTDSTFWILHHLLKPALEKVAKKSSLLRRRCHHQRKKRRMSMKRTAPNGLIPTSIRLSIALRYFAGGDPLDIALVHGMSHSEIFTSVWMIVDAIHQTRKLDIIFPKSHEEQRRLAREFHSVSKAGIDICVAATDGILIWIPKPTDHECEKMQCGAKKFFCGRKKKFGLNMQGTCDVKGRFLDVSIYHPGSTSDYLAFVTSPLYHKLERPDFLAPGLAIFGDGAYSANHYMVTPFKMAKSGSKDVFNFYQSQLRIRIECAFGMLVHRWAILRKAMPYGISVRKTTALVFALCKIHNFCIDQNESIADAGSCQDSFHVAMGGGIEMTDWDEDFGTMERGLGRPSEVLDGGDHRDDYNRVVTRLEGRIEARNNVNSEIPQVILLRSIEEQNLARPRPKGWTRGGAS
jgi:DDE superfamily endonuclease